MLIALEGVANVGKSTLAKRLAGFDKKFEFPDFAGHKGQLIKDIVEGRKTVKPLEYATLFASNMYDQREEIISCLREGGHVLCDRYVASNIVYGQVAGGGGVGLSELLDMNRDMPKADCTILFDGPRYTSLNEGFQESDDMLQEAARTLYESMVNSEIGWIKLRYEKNESINIIYERLQKIIDEKLLYG